MKKFILGFIIGALLFSVTRIDASSVLEVVQFPAKLILNGESTTLNDGYSILNYNGSAYVPIRFIAESLNARVGYVDGPERIISINDPHAKLPEDYPEELARQNGDVFFAHRTQTYNEEQISDFISKVDSKINSWIRIARYTPEGDPIIQLLSYNDGKFNYTLDTTRDKFGVKEIKEMECSSLVSLKGELDGFQYTEYLLKGCTPYQETTTFYTLYAK